MGAHHFLLVWIGLAFLNGCAAKTTPFPPSAAKPDVATFLAAAHSVNGPGKSQLSNALEAITTAEDITSDNLANANTLAYKARRVVFFSANQAAIQFDMSQGPTEITNRSLDVSIQGPGYIRVKVLDNVGDGTAYTRNGNFFINKDGNLVLALGEGYRIQPLITFPQGITEKDISIAESGVVSYRLSTSNTSQQAGTIQLVNFINPEGLNLVGGSLFRETQASGPASIENLGDNGTGIFKQGSLEGSNVVADRESLALQRLRNWRAQILQALYDSK